MKTTKTPKAEAVHSPLPWKWIGSKGEPNRNIYLSCPGGYATWSGDDDESRENAKLIVEAVNSHARLLADRARLRDALHKISNNSGARFWNSDASSADIDAFRDIHDAARAALKATES